MKQFHKLSLITVIATCCFISIYRINNVREKEISWDVLGYYLYLPATFIHHDPLLNDISWLKQVNAEKQLTDTLYMVSQNKQRESMYFFLMGMSLFYLPFFFAGHIFSSLQGYATDGFSLPYQYSLVLGGIITTITGLIFLRKILVHFFSEKLSALIILIIVFGTNYIQHLTLDNLGTVNVIFTLNTIIIWNTIKWHEHFKNKHLFIIGVCITLAAMVKPTEVFIILIPLLWKVTSKTEWKQKSALLLEHKKTILLTIGVCFIIVLPQMIYWQIKTGTPIYDSYKNSGVGLDFLSPHVIDTLFSYRKGWLLYTPIMVFSLTGFYFLYKNNKQIFFSSIIYFSISFYIITSWTEWWYGAGFSIRPLIATYPILAICLGYFLQYISSTKLYFKIFIGSLIVFFIFLNQFQWWQYKNYILDPYRTTKAYYWSTFLKTTVSASDKELLLIYRDFTGNMSFINTEKYRAATILFNESYKIKENEEFYPIFESTFNKLTSKDHAWIKVSFNVMFPNNFSAALPCMVMTMDRKGGPYGYYAPEIKYIKANIWQKVEFTYLTPEIRNSKDLFKCYIWNRGKSSLDIHNFKIESYQRK